MLKPNGVFLIENIIVEIFVIVSTHYILVLILASFDLNADLFPLAHAEQGLTIEHNIQAKSQLNNCTLY
jgi:hypothetical protein